MSRATRAGRRIASVSLAAVLAALVLAQSDDSQQNVPTPVPPPPAPDAPRDTAEDAAPYQSIVPESSAPWGLEPQLLEALHRSADTYLQYSRRFVCEENARIAEYDGEGQVGREDVRNYEYLLLSGESGETVRELRQLRDRRGNIKDEVEDAEPFPPAYAWVFLFGRSHEAYFAFRKIDTYFEGFDLVHEIQFRGSLSFTDGRDVRQWEGTVLVDAFKLVPVVVRAEPANQRRRIEEIYRRWAQSFSILGMRTKAPPLGYQATIDYGHRRDGLAFPTLLRYDTFRAISPTQVVMVRASTRSYTNYRFVVTGAEPEIIGPVAEPEKR
jgi:hypothetical protein